jgi:hypothetical protein
MACIECWPSQSPTAVLRSKKRYGKAKAGAPNLSVIKPERPEPNNAATEIRQAYGKRSRAVTVEFVLQNRSSRQKPG